MALVTKTLTLDITPGAIPQVVNVSEYDENREYTVTLIDEGGTYEIPSGTTATVEGTIGGNGFSEAATVSGNTITFTLTESMTAKAGNVWCKIKLVKDSKPIQTAAFILRCDKAGVEADTLINASGFDAQLQAAVDVWMESQDGIGEAQLALASTGATEIPSGSDFDGYKTPGNYFVSSAANAGNITNCPANVAGRLTVMETHGTGRVKQTYELSREDGATYTRYFNGTAWGEWNLEEGKSVLSYWDSAITTAADAINNQRAVTINGTDYTINSGLSGDRFVFVTDTHWTWGAKHTPQIIQKLLREVGGMKLFHGGDIVDGNISNVGESATDAEKQERQSWYKRLLCESKAALDAGSPMYYCIGNHEYFNPDQAAAFVDWQLTSDEVYRAVVSGMGDQIIDHDALGDYCFDNTANKIRYFFIASNPAAQIDEGSATWLASALDEMPTGYTAIVISHVALNTVINEDSTSAHYGEVVPLSRFNKIVTVLEAAKAKGIDIGFVISGHTHVDRYCYTDGGILIVTTATDAYRKTKEGWAEDGSTREGYNTMTPGTATEHCFDVVSFDTTTRTVALTRVGAGTSRAFTF